MKPTARLPHLAARAALIGALAAGAWGTASCSDTTSGAVPPADAGAAEIGDSEVDAPDPDVSDTGGAPEDAVLDAGDLGSDAEPDARTDGPVDAPDARDGSGAGDAGADADATADVDADGDADVDADTASDTDAADATPDVGPPGPLAFRLDRVRVPALEAHADLGFQMGVLFDADGDGLQDLFIGVLDGGLPACLFRNVSTPGNIAFEPDPAYCGGAGNAADVLVPNAIDLNGDGVDELLGGDATGHIEIYDMRGAPVAPQLLARVSSFPCAPNPYDADLDGDLDVYSWCLRPEGGYLMQEAGEWTSQSPTRADPMGDWGIMMALGFLDLDGDGLLDLARALDTHSFPGVRNIADSPGGAAIRCAPPADCRHQEVRYADGVEAWGSYMGFGNLHIEGVGDVLYISDVGPNRALLWTEDGPVDVAEAHGIELATAIEDDGTVTDRFLFSWGVVVEDFDLDGHDDLYVSNGGDFRSVEEAGAIWEDHHDALFMQRPGGVFEDVAGAVGITRRDEPTDSVDGRPYQARGVIKADLDLDGTLELVEFSRHGRLRMYTQRFEDPEAPSRCTLDPRPSVVPAHGFGFAIAAAPGARFYRRDVQGQYFLRAPRTLLSSVQSGVLRFPSGATLPFDCAGSAGPVRVDEPDWLSVSVIGPLLTVSVDRAAAGIAAVELAAAVDTGDGMNIVPLTELEEGLFVADLSAAPERVMVRIDDRWVGRWW